MRIAIAGLGTVGCGLINMINAQADQYQNNIEIVAVNARSRDKKRDADVAAYEWCDDPLSFATRDDIDLVVELIGGSEGIAKDLVMACLAQGKAVITANKALIADHGLEIAALAEQNKAFFGYEAAVAGGIAVIKTLRESFAGNEVQSVSGILNGTCNYILSVMRDTGRDFADVLDDAQALGYAEADPTFDVEGIDAAHKLAILAALSFGVKVPFSNVPVRGIREVSAADITYATQMGYRIKLLGLAQKQDDAITLSVEPCFVHKHNPIAHIDDVLNAVMIDAEPLGRSMLVGRGAGAGPTASSVYADVLDACQGLNIPLYGRNVTDLQDLPANFESVQNDQTMRAYVRLQVQDQAGVIADLTAILRDHDISISDMIQHGHDNHNPVDLILMLHETKRGAIEQALATMQALPSVLNAPMMMRIVA